MTFKKLLIILTITVTVLMIALLGTSYAWYQFDNAVTNFDNVQTFSKDIDLATVFTNTDNISTTVGVPLTTAQVDEYSSKTLFSITPSSSAIGSMQVAYQISLVDLSVDSKLTETEDLKYSLIEKIGDGTATTIASGNFYGFNSNTLTLKSMTKITTLDTTYSYEFRIWLQESGGNQNDLMGQKVSGKIKISTALK